MRRPGELSGRQVKRSTSEIHRPGSLERYRMEYSRCPHENGEGHHFCASVVPSWRSRARHVGLLKTDEKFRGGCGQPVSRALAAVDVRQAAARSHTAAHLAKRTLTSRSALERGRSKAPVPFLCGLTHATTVAARARSARW